MSPCTKSALLTLAVLLIGGGILIVWDIYVAVTYGYPATISAEMLRLGKSHPIIPAAVCLILGVLIGHFWWPQ